MAISIQKSVYNGDGYKYGVSEVGYKGLTATVPYKITWASGDGPTVEDLYDAVYSDVDLPQIDDVWDNLFSGNKYLSGMRVVDRKLTGIVNNADPFAYFVVTYAMTSEPPVDGDWAVVWRGSTHVENRGFYYSERDDNVANIKPIQVKFKPKGMTVIDWSGFDNQRKYLRGQSVPVQIPSPTIVLRKKISSEKYEELLVYQWIDKYVGKINNDILGVGNVGGIGCYLITDLQINPLYCTDEGLTHYGSPVYDIRIEIAYSKEGWDPYVFFVDAQNNCRWGNITIHPDLVGGDHTAVEIGNPDTGGMIPDTNQYGWGIFRPFMYFSEAFIDPPLSFPADLIR
jgi:hypothetical protein